MFHLKVDAFVQVDRLGSIHVQIEDCELLLGIQVAKSIDASF